MARLRALVSFLAPLGVALSIGCVDVEPALESSAQAVVEAPGDFDGDGVDDLADLDDDNDGLNDVRETDLGVDPDGDADDDGVPDWQDASDQGPGTIAPCPDAEADGRCDTLPILYDTDADGVPDHRDLDADDDGIADVVEIGRGHGDVDHDGMVDGPVNQAGQPTVSLGGPIDQIALDSDADGRPDLRDLDSDGDGAYDLDEVDGAALDADRDGRIDGGHGEDGDGIADAADASPEAYGYPGIDAAQFDTDGDGVLDPYDAATGEYGDADADGVADSLDTQPGDPTRCQDIDGDTCDDCTTTTADGTGGDWFADGPDLDADGLCDVGDDDLDNDGVANALDPDDASAAVCGDVDADTCDDCAVGKDGFGPEIDSAPGADGPDADADGLCDAGDFDHGGGGEEVSVPDHGGDEPANPKAQLGGTGPGLLGELGTIPIQTRGK